MSDLQFNCPICKKPLSVSDELYGRQIDCPACGDRIQLPKSGFRPVVQPAKNKAGNASGARPHRSRGLPRTPIMIPLLLAAVVIASPYWSSNRMIKAINILDTARVAKFLQHEESALEGSAETIIARVKGAEGRAYIAARRYDGFSHFILEVSSTSPEIQGHRIRMQRCNVILWRVLEIESE